MFEQKYYSKRYIVRYTLQICIKQRKIRTNSVFSWISKLRYFREYSENEVLLKLSTAVKLFHKMHLRFLDPVHKKLNTRYWSIKSYKTPHFYFHTNPIKLTIHRTSSNKPLLPKTQSRHYKNEPIPTP